MHKTYVVRNYSIPIVEGGIKQTNISSDEDWVLSSLLKPEENQFKIIEPSLIPDKNEFKDTVNKVAFKFENGDMFDGEIRENKFNGIGTYV